MIVLSENDIISPGDLPHYIKNKDMEAETGSQPVSGTKNPGSLVEVEKEHIKKILASSNGNRTESGADTGNGAERTLYQKIKEYGLDE